MTSFCNRMSDESGQANAVDLPQLGTGGLPFLLEGAAEPPHGLVPQLLAKLINPLVTAWANHLVLP